MYDIIFVEKKYMYNSELMRGKEVFNILKNQLSCALDEITPFSIYSARQLEFLDSSNWSCEEPDGVAYISQALLLLAHENCDMNSSGVHIVVHATPFNCYFGIGNENSLKTVAGVDSIEFQKDKDLTIFYRQQMKSLLGDWYKLKFDKYISKAKESKINKAKREYDNKVDELTKAYNAEIADIAIEIENDEKCF